jgi:hypothetical protein
LLSHITDITCTSSESSNGHLPTSLFSTTNLFSQAKQTNKQTWLLAPWITIEITRTALMKNKMMLGQTTGGLFGIRTGKLGQDWVGMVMFE